MHGKVHGNGIAVGSDRDDRPVGDACGRVNVNARGRTRGADANRPGSHEARELPNGIAVVGGIAANVHQTSVDVGIARILGDPPPDVRVVGAHRHRGVNLSGGRNGVPYARRTARRGQVVLGRPDFLTVVFGVRIIGDGGSVKVTSNDAH